MFDTIIATGRAGTMTAEDIALLATQLADSGTRLAWPDSASVADLSSTGGPGSLSTLLAPLELRRLGFHVVKLGVPGRPAGGIDVLGTVPGYETNLSPAAVQHVIRQCGYAHFRADGQFAPMDAAFFAYRQTRGATAIPALAAASLLSKKIAVGVQVVGLDVRVGPHGNFGATMEEARQHAGVFCDAARLVGIRAVAFLFESSRLEQPWIGRGESLIAMDRVLSGEASGVLQAHAARCYAMAQLLAAELPLPADESPLESADEKSRTRERRRALDDHLQAQGATPDGFRERVHGVESAIRSPIHAECDGTVVLDVAALRDSIVTTQRRVESQQRAPGSPDKSGFADPAGVIVSARGGAHVRAGDVLCEVRVSEALSAAEREQTRLEIARAFMISDKSEGRSEFQSSMEVVRA